MKQAIKEEEQVRQEKIHEKRTHFLKSIFNKKKSGELSAIEAMQLIEAEGYKPPKSLEMEVKMQLLNYKEEPFTQSILTEEQRKEVDEFKKLLAEKYDCD